MNLNEIINKAYGNSTDRDKDRIVTEVKEFIDDNSLHTHVVPVSDMLTHVVDYMDARAIMKSLDIDDIIQFAINNGDSDTILGAMDIDDIRTYAMTHDAD